MYSLKYSYSETLSYKGAMERSPEFFFTLDTVVGEGMPKIKDSNDRVEETGKQGIKTGSCDNCGQRSSFKQS